MQVQDSKSGLKESEGLPSCMRKAHTAHTLSSPFRIYNVFIMR
jgi:hypothetical protein